MTSKNITDGKIIFFLLLPLLWMGCSSGPKREAIKAENLNTELKSSEMVDSKSKTGIDQDGNVMISEQTAVSEYLHNLENEVRIQNDELYGTPDLNSKGLVGQLKDCYRKNPKAPGAVALSEIPYLPAEMQTDLDDFKKAFKKEKSEGSTTDVGYNEKGQLVRNKTEDLHLRIDRFQKIKGQLQQNRVVVDDKLADCRAASAN